MKSSILLLLVLITLSAGAQVLTKEDSLNANLVKADRATMLSGYGEAKYTFDKVNKTATVDLTRNVIFLGHKFSNRVFMFSEMELEHAAVEEDKHGEISMEQLFIKFNINPSHYITAGLFIPRIGIVNENHLPTTYNGNDRPFVEQLVIPATWRELGVSMYGPVPGTVGLNYSVSVMNGLNSAAFNSEKGIREGRGEGSKANASNLAVHASLLHYWKKLRSQASIYYGGSAGLTSRDADSLQLSYGTFGTPVQVMEVNTQYQGRSFHFKVLGAMINLPDAYGINRAYASNVGKQILGTYAEMSYDFLAKKSNGEKGLLAFIRYEWLDTQAKTPENGIRNQANRRSYIVTGLVFKPTRGVVIKADYVSKHTGAVNTSLMVTPFPQPTSLATNWGFFNLGLGYSF